MSLQDDYLLTLDTDGLALQIRERSAESGVRCGCWTWRGTGYSKEWHRSPNPGKDVADCLGTGIVPTDLDTSTVNLKGIVYQHSMNSSTTLPPLFQTVIAKMKFDPWLLIGCLNVDTSTADSLALYDFSSVNEQEEEILYDSKIFKIRAVAKIYTVAYQVLLQQHG